MKRMRSKPIQVLLSLVLALILVGLTTQTWATVHVPQAAVVTSDIVVKGSDMLPGVTAFALVAAAAALAMSIARPVLARVCAGLIALAGIAVVLNVFGAIANPIAATQQKVGKSTGVLGDTSIQVSISAVPVITLIVAAVLTLAGIFAFFAAASWKRAAGSGSRFERPGTKPSGRAGGSGNAKDRAIDSWDTLSQGSDPTAEGPSREID